MNFSINKYGNNFENLIIHFYANDDFCSAVTCHNLCGESRIRYFDKKKLDGICMTIVLLCICARSLIAFTNYKPFTCTNCTYNLY